MMDILSPLESSDGFSQIFSTGLFHGFFFSLPFSIPMLICFRRYLLDGFSLGNYAFAGTLLGHLSFVFCTVQGIRPIIHFWYPFEPLLSLFGLGLSLKIATDFFSQRRFVFDGTLGSSEDSSAYAMNPWPKIPNISWENLTGSPLPRPIERFLDSLFFAWSSIIDLIVRFLPQPLRVSFEKVQNFCQRNLGPSIFSFQFILMWLNPASASTLNLLFFEHDLLRQIFVSPNSPIFLLYTLGFIIAATTFCGVALFILSQLAGRSFSFASFQAGKGLRTSGSNPAVSGFGWKESRSNWLESFIGFDEALAQKRYKLLNKFFTFLILGCLIQSGLNYSWRLFLQYPLEMIHWDFFNSQKLFNTFKRNPQMSLGPVGTELSSSQFSAPKELFQNQPLNSTSNRQSMDPTSLGAPLSVADLGQVPLLEPDEIRLASSLFIGDSKESYWADVEKSQDFTFIRPGGVAPVQPGSTRPSVAPDVLSSADPQDGTESRGFFGRREFPPYDTSIRNREKNLPVERHLAIERVNSRRALMGRPPLENEERENAIFKYHTFFINQIDRSVEDFKMKLVTPKELYREEDDILALKKLHENYLKQKGRESGYQKSFLPKKGNSPRTARHDKDFFTKSRPVTNTTKGLLKSSYIRDLFDENLREAARSYSHDDLLLENIIK